MERERLIGAGADLIIPDYGRLPQLIDYLFPEEQASRKREDSAYSEIAGWERLLDEFPRNRFGVRRFLPDHTEIDTGLDEPSLETG